jgi:hypothetical protein
MGKVIMPPPRPDPIRFKASRVEKQRAPQKARRDFPAWFYRIAGIEWTKNRDIRPIDYDEDLSELEEADEPSSEQDSACECDDSECEFERHLEDEDSMDNESERSREGSVAEYYYELKDEREERKRELLNVRKRNEEKKEEHLKFEKAKEDEVNATYESFKKARRRAKKKGRTIPIDSIAGQGFKLYFSDYVDREEFYDELYSTKRVDFYHLDMSNQVSRTDGKQVGGEEKSVCVYGDMYLDSSANCSFGPFRLPTYARRKDVKIKSCDGKYDLLFKFFGNGYLKLSVSRDLVFNSGGTDSSSVAMVDFVGVLRDLEKEKEERMEKQKQHAQNRSPSPPESWLYK